MKQVLKESEEGKKQPKPTIPRILLWFALGSIIIVASIPRVYERSQIQWAPFLGIILGLFGVGMGITQVIYLRKKEREKN